MTLTGSNIVVIDIETLRSADDCLQCGASLERHALDFHADYHSYDRIGWDRKTELGLSIGCAWDYQEMAHSWFDAHTLEATMRSLVLRQPLLVGFNSIQFDFSLMRGLLRRRAQDQFNRAGDRESYHLVQLCDAFKALCAQSYDILQAIWAADAERKFEHGLNSLDAISKAMGFGAKAMTGAEAPRLWAQGRIAEVLNYCAADVDKTRRLFEHILEYGQVVRGDGQPLALPSPDLTSYRLTTSSR